MSFRAGFLRWVGLVCAVPLANAQETDGKLTPLVLRSSIALSLTTPAPKAKLAGQNASTPAANDFGVLKFTNAMDQRRLAAVQPERTLQLPEDPIAFEAVMRPVKPKEMPLLKSQKLPPRSAVRLMIAASSSFGSA